MTGRQSAPDCGWLPAKFPERDPAPLPAAELWQGHSGKVRRRARRPIVRGCLASALAFRLRTILARFLLLDLRAGATCRPCNSLGVGLGRTIGKRWPGSLVVVRFVKQNNIRPHSRSISFEMDFLGWEINRLKSTHGFERRQSFLATSDGANERGFETAFDPA